MTYICRECSQPCIKTSKDKPEDGAGGCSEHRPKAKWKFTADIEIESEGK